MKKAYFVMFTALCMLLLAACAKEDPLGKIAQRWRKERLSSYQRLMPT